MNVIARCQECKKSVGGIITSEHSCCYPEYTCENCMSQSDKDSREDPEMHIYQCRICWKVSKLENSRYECGHKNPYTNWCNRCHENPATRFNVGGSYDHTNDVCDDCFEKDYDKQTGKLVFFTEEESQKTGDVVE